MDATRLGRTGLYVSPICLGTQYLGSRLDEAASVELLDHAHELGITFFDMGDIYPYPPDPATWGRTEEIFGRWARGKRDQVVIGTKCGFPAWAGANGRGGSRKHVVEACEASLRRLGVEAIDLLYLHTSTPDTPLDETLGALDDLVRAGKVHYVGLSNYEAWELALAAQEVAVGGLTRIAAAQISFSLVRRAPERDLLPFAEACGIGVVPYYALASGLLSGKFDRSAGLPDDYRLFTAYRRTGRGVDPERQVEPAWAVVDAVREVAEELGVSMSEVAIAWVLGAPAVTTTIVGASRPEQLDPAVAAPALELPPELRARLDEASLAFR